MVFNKKAAVAFLALAFLFLAYCGEATRICSETNRNYHGPCMSNKNCASACVSEGYDGGYCSRRKRRPPTAGIQWSWPWPRRVRRCKCTRKCQGASSPAAGGGGGDLPPVGEDPPIGEAPPLGGAPPAFGEGPPFAMAGMRV